MFILLTTYMYICMAFIQGSDNLRVVYCQGNYEVPYSKLLVFHMHLSIPNREDRVCQLLYQASIYVLIPQYMLAQHSNRIITDRQRAYLYNVCYENLYNIYNCIILCGQYVTHWKYICSTRLMCIYKLPPPVHDHLAGQ